VPFPALSSIPLYIPQSQPGSHQIGQKIQPYSAPRSMSGDLQGQEKGREKTSISGTAKASTRRRGSVEREWGPTIPVPDYRAWNRINQKTTSLNRKAGKRPSIWNSLAKEKERRTNTVSEPKSTKHTERKMHFPRRPSLHSQRRKIPSPAFLKRKGHVNHRSPTRTGRWTRRGKGGGFRVRSSRRNRESKKKTRAQDQKAEDLCPQPGIQENASYPEHKGKKPDDEKHKAAGV